jgi:hypothetical protein
MPTHSDLPNGDAAVFQDNSYHGEDTYVTRELNRHIAIDAVFDGATGRGGADASGYAAKTLQEATVDTVDGITALLDMANQRLFQRGRGRFFLTTASVTSRSLNASCAERWDSPVFLIESHDIMSLTGTAQVPRSWASPMRWAATISSPTKRPTSARRRRPTVVATDGLIENIAPSELLALIDAAPRLSRRLPYDNCSVKKQGNKGRVDESSGFRRDDATAIIRYIRLAPS